MLWIHGNILEKFAIMNMTNLNSAKKLFPETHNLFHFDGLNNY